MSANFFDRERAALESLIEAIRLRASGEAEITSTRESATDKAEREITRARKLNTATRENELRELEAVHFSGIREINARCDQEQLAADRAREEKRDATLERFKAAEAKARNEFKDRLWALDSVLEGKEHEAKEQMHLLQRKAESGREEIADLIDEKEEILARAGIPSRDLEPATPIELERENDPISLMQKAIATATTSLAALRSLFLPGFANFKGLAICVLLGSLIGSAGFLILDLVTASAIAAAIGTFGGLGLWALVCVSARRQTLRAGSRVSLDLAIASAAAEQLHEFAATEYALEHNRIHEKHARKKKDTQDHYEPLLEKQKMQLDIDLNRIETDRQSQNEIIAKRRDSLLHAQEVSHTSRYASAKVKLDNELEAAEKNHREKIAVAAAIYETGWQRIATDWKSITRSIATELHELRSQGAALFASWDQLAGDKRTLSTIVPAGLPYGQLEIDLSRIPDAISSDPRLSLPDDVAGSLPAFLPFPDRCALVLKARDEGRTQAVQLLQATMLRFLTALPPGKVRFTIIDPVGLGENFASFMHLADFDEKLVTSQIWTESRQIEQRLVDLTDHIAAVIQKYLRNQYKTIEEYNQAAGEVAEAYRVLVVANFPAGFTPEAAQRLLSIVASGPSCGVCTLVSVDSRAAMPRDFVLADLEAPSLTLNWRDGKFSLKDPLFAPFPLTLQMPPDPATTAKIVQWIGKAGKEAVRVEVPFDYIAPRPEDIWRGSAAKGFEVPVGRAGATRRQVFTLGRGTAQHALIAGKTGSGKSTLLHALITNLAMIYSPDEAELYLIDFKEGVEFQWYATYKLPHARVVAIQSEREFGLSVLQRLDGILRERGERFRDAGVNDLASFRAATPELKTPRILLVVDEFQQFFVEDDKLSQEASLLLDRLVRQGRAFGLHVLLGSQTLGGAYSLARSTIDQMAVRVALQCSDADAQLILSKDNNAARLLSRPGEAIYNDQNGLVEGNDPFQVVWLAEEKREELLRDLGTRAGGNYPPPLVFEGNSAADPSRNPALARAIEKPRRGGDVKSPLLWLGDPVAIKEPTVVALRTQGAANLLLIGQNEEAARGLFATSLVAMATQAPATLGVVTLLDGTPDDADEAEYLHRVGSRFGQMVFAASRVELPGLLAELSQEVERRQKRESQDRTPKLLMVFGIHRFRELRKSDDDMSYSRRGVERETSPAERFSTILREGPLVGIHTVVWCDSLTNLNRTFDRPLLREFGSRVLFQMSPTDSSTLMDSPAASRLGRNRALFLQEDQERPEKFRPYGLPLPEWLDSTATSLRINEQAVAAG